MGEGLQRSHLRIEVRGDSWGLKERGKMEKGMETPKMQRLQGRGCKGHWWVAMEKGDGKRRPGSCKEEERLHGEGRPGAGISPTTHYSLSLLPILTAGQLGMCYPGGELEAGTRFRWIFPSWVGKLEK